VKYKSIFLYYFDRKKYNCNLLDTIQVKGRNIELNAKIKLERPQGLVLGKNVEFSGEVTLDAKGGVLIGDDVKLGDNIKISSFCAEHDPLDYNSYQPVYINRATVIESNSIIKPGTCLGHDVSFNKTQILSSKVPLFVLSTGRSGSNAISKILSQHSQVQCVHDAFAPMNKFVCDLLYKNDSEENIKNSIKRIFDNITIGEKKVYGQSDQKLGALVTILKEIFPECKFIWLVRNPIDFINSAYPRGWYRNREFGYEEIDGKEFYESLATPSDFHAAHRINGYKIGIFSAEEWKEMTAFERLCWYYKYWNELIENQLHSLPESDFVKVDLKDLKSRTSNLQSFLGLQTELLTVTKFNQAKYKKLSYKDWTSEMKNIYSKYFPV